MSKNANSDLAWEEWVALGEALKTAKKLLFKIEAGPKTGYKAGRVRKAMKNVDTACDVLDGLVCKAFPDKPSVGHVFYGPRHPDE